MSFAPLRRRYDRLADTLYLTIADSPVTQGIESDGIVYRYDQFQRLVGITIMDFDDYWRTHFDDLVQEISDHSKLAPGTVEAMFVELEQ